LNKRGVFPPHLEKELSHLFLLKIPEKLTKNPEDLIGVALAGEK
jgi:hypothetical protein